MPPNAPQCPPACTSACPPAALIRGSGLKTRARMLLTPLPSGEQPAFIMLVAAASGQLRRRFCLSGGGVRVSMELEDAVDVCVEDVADTDEDGECVPSLCCRVLSGGWV